MTTGGAPLRPGPDRPAEPWIIGGGWSMPAFGRGTPSVTLPEGVAVHADPEFDW